MPSGTEVKRVARLVTNRQGVGTLVYTNENVPYNYKKDNMRAGRRSKGQSGDAAQGFKGRKALAILGLGG